MVRYTTRRPVRRRRRRRGRAMYPRRRRPLTMSVRRPAFTPSRKFVRMSCISSVYLDSTSGLTVNYDLNSATNPFRVYSSNQPRGFDEYTTLYARCIVHSFVVVVKGLNANSGDDAHVAMVVSAGTTPPDLTAYRLGELPLSASRIALKASQNVVRMQISGKVSMVYGSYLDRTDFGQLTTSTTAPNKKVKLLLRSDPIDASGNVNFQGTVKLTQVIEFYDRAPVGPS